MHKSLYLVLYFIPLKLVVYNFQVIYNVYSIIFTTIVAPTINHNARKKLLIKDLSCIISTYGLFYVQVYFITYFLLYK